MDPIGSKEDQIAIRKVPGVVAPLGKLDHEIVWPCAISSLDVLLR